MPTSPRRRVALGATTLTVLAFGASACGGSSDAASTGHETLNVGQLGSAKVTAALLHASGQDKGMKYSINWSMFPTGGGGFMEAVPSGAVDVALMADTPPIFGQVAGVPTKVVGVETTTAPGTSTVEIFAHKDSGITTMADLKGKKVALTEGTILQYTVVRALEKAGLNYKDITPVNLPPADAATAYQSGDVDAVAALGPQLAGFTVAGDKVVGDGVGTTSGYQYAVATSKAISNPTKLSEITDYLQRVGKAQQWAASHKDEWTKTYAATLGVPAALAQVLVDREIDHFVPIDQTVIDAQQSEADAYTKLGLIKQKLDVGSEFDDRLNTELAGK